MRCAKCVKILRHATICSHFWHSTNENVIYVYYYFIHLSLSSWLKYNFIFTFSYSFSASPSPLSHTLFFSLLLFSASQCHFSLSYTPFNFLSTISQIPPSLIYKIRFTGFFFPFFFRSLLSVLWSDTLNQFSSSQSRRISFFYSRKRKVQNELNWKRMSWNSKKLPNISIFCKLHFSS